MIPQGESRVIPLPSMLLNHEAQLPGFVDVALITLCSRGWGDIAMAAKLD